MTTQINQQAEAFIMLYKTMPLEVQREFESWFYGYLTNDAKMEYNEREFVQKKTKKPQMKLSEMFAGCLSAEEGEKLNQYLKQSRDEWEKDF